INILIVNASDEVNTLFKKIMETLGFKHVFSVEDATNAIQYMREVRFNLVVTDLELKAHFGQGDSEESPAAKARAAKARATNAPAPEAPAAESPAEETPAEKKSVAISGIDFTKRLRFAPSSP